MPIKSNDFRDKICHEGLCDLVDNDQIKAREEYSSLLRIIGGVLSMVGEGDEVASETTCGRLVGILHAIQASVGGSEVNAAFATLSPESQQAIVSAMQ